MTGKPDPIQHSRMTMTVHFLESSTTNGHVTVSEEYKSFVGEDLPDLIGQWLAFRYKRPKPLVLGFS